VKVVVATLAGTPLMTPSSDNVKPGGIDVDDQKYGCVPPVAANVCEYALPTAPLGSVAGVVIDNCPATVMENVTGSD
jgi:hypothetical protein